MPVRLNKYIADSGVASRRKAEELILQGRVSVNNKIMMELSFKVDEDKDEVLLDGERIAPRKHIYILMNKPKGVVTTTSDEKGRRTVLDLLKIKEKIYPVGRLDFNTTGVLILTNDGDFTNLLTHPRNNVPREYEVLIDRPLEDKDKETLLKGVYIEQEKGVFQKITFPKKNSRTYLLVTATEGRNHFVKKMFGALAYDVKALNRRSFAGFFADVPPGAYRNLSDDEIKRIIQKYA